MNTSRERNVDASLFVAGSFAPMGGVEQSGPGRERGHLGTDEFVETTYVCLDV